MARRVGRLLFFLPTLKGRWSIAFVIPAAFFNYRKWKGTHTGKQKKERVGGGGGRALTIKQMFFLFFSIKEKSICYYF